MTSGSGKSDAWVRFPEPTPGARLRLFCFPYAGAGVSAFRGWQAALGSNVEVCLVQLPGREDRLREAPYNRLTELLPTLLAAVEPHLDRPFALFGHSVGGLISFELIRALRRTSGPQPSRLCVSARRAPQSPDRASPLHGLSDAEFVEALRRRYNGIPQAIFESPELLELVLPGLRADIELSETYTYQPEPPLDCPISVFGGLEDSVVDPEELDDWRVQTAAGFSLRMLQGDHFFLKSAVAELTAAVAADLSTIS